MNNDRCRNEICPTCPGTNWGGSLYCKIKESAVSYINDCPEWQKDPTQLLDPLIDILQRTEEDIKDHNFMVDEMIRLREYLQGAGEGVTRQMNADSDMPKAKNKKSDPVYYEVQRRQRQEKRLQQLEGRLHSISDALAVLADDKERTVIECIMDGLKPNAIAQHIGVSRSRFYEIRRSAIAKMAKALHGRELQGVS
ncbi:sigma-70 family RNA polymerase sigma factor [Heliobacterium chlorum]|uniref:Sigma-70 family RNA polymerase sigma factor n=1 Tax=Heliobacterium chlorum TaxID=2698 RepID=A0ABR7SYB3_HELCL|nr:sigma-70 family RNA polymerase sigma factor [Heliobacterium chlorum]MBC9783530.1 sigma-70 family RNA polymerase sigma factor [Heliobacterium chlorum]